MKGKMSFQRACRRDVDTLAGLRHRVQMERVKGIEPSYSAWKAAALPLSYTRIGR